MPSSTKLLAFLLLPIGWACPGTTGFHPELVGEDWGCAPKDVVVQEVERACTGPPREATNPPSWEAHYRSRADLIFEAVIDLFVLLAGVDDDSPAFSSPPTSRVPGGTVGSFSEECSAVFEIRGCGRERRAVCINDGRCWLVERPRPRATTDEACRALSECALMGRCSVPDPAGPSAHRECVATSDADCAASLEACAMMGRCVARNDRCEVGSSEHCERSTGCLDRGRCTALEGTCVATSDLHCASSSECDSRGRCFERDGVCVSAPPATARPAMEEGR